MSITQNFRSLNIHQFFYTADKIILNWRENRRCISRKIDDVNPCNMNLPQHNKCHPTSMGTCCGCLIASRLFPRGEIKFNQPISILTGSYIGTKLIVKQQDNSKFSGYNIVDNVYTNKGEFIEQYIVISSIIEYEFIKFGIPCVPSFIWAWQCCNKINYVEQIFSLGRGTFTQIQQHKEFFNNSVLLPNIVRGIISQLIVCLDFLSNYDFVHGLPSINSLAFSNTYNSFKYRQFEISAPITLHLIPSGYSSLNIISSTVPDKIIKLKHPGKPNIKEYPPPVFEMNSDYYRITGQVAAFMQYNGVNYFKSSFDLYALFVALMAEPLFRSSVLADPISTAIWKSMFLVEDYDKLMFEVGSLLHPSYYEIVMVLSSYVLQLNVLDTLYAKLGDLQA